MLAWGRRTHLWPGKAKKKKTTKITLNQTLKLTCDTLAQIDEISCCGCQGVSPHRTSSWIRLKRSHRVLPIEQISSRARTTPVDALPFSPQTRLRRLRWVRSRPMVWGECHLQYQICQWPTQCILDLLRRRPTLRRIKGNSPFLPPPPLSFLSLTPNPTVRTSRGRDFPCCVI